MPDEAPAAPVTVATPATPAPVRVDPNAAALALFNKPAAVVVDPKASAPSASNPGAPEAGKAATAPGTAEPAAADPPLTAEALRTQQQTLSAGFGKLAAAKAQLHEREQALKPLERWRGVEEKVKADPAAVLELHGITLEQLAEAVLKRQGIQPEAPTAEERLAALEADRKKETEEAAKTKDEQAEEAQQAAIAVGVKTVKDILDATPDAFPVSIAKGEERMVFDTVLGYAMKHNIPFDQVTPQMVRVVAAAYEEARQTQVDEELSALVTKVPKLAARFAPPKLPETPAATAPTGEQRQGAQASSVTLVGTHSEAPPPQKPTGRLSPAELDRRALEVMNAGKTRPQA